MLLFKFLHRILWLITTIVIIHTGIKLTISLKGAQVTLLPDMFKTLLKKEKIKTQYPLLKHFLLQREHE